MASSGSFNTGGYQGRCLRFEWWENAQSIEGNYTDIGYQLKGYGTATSTWYMAGNFKLVVNGSTVYETGYSDRIKLYNGTVLKTGTMRIYHNADGSKSFSASATGGIYTYDRNVSGSNSWALDKIPRAATISSAPNFTDEDNPVIKYSNPAGTVVDDLQACIASTDGSTVYIDYRAISETGYSYTFNFTDDERETLQSLCKNVKSMKVKFYIRTKLGSSTLYSSAEKTLTIANAAPTLSPTVKDTNATTKALTGDEAKFIKGYSNAAFTVGASALKKATIKSQKVTCGEKTSSSASGTLSAVESGTFTFSVTDSRGYTTTEKLTKTLIDYVELTCSMKASNPTADGDMAMRIIGSYFNGSFGATANTLTVQYRHSTDGGSTWGAWVDVEATLSGNSYTADVNLTGLDYRQAHTFQARAVDKLATVNSAERTVRSIPVFDWGEDSFTHNTNLYFGVNGAGQGAIYGPLPDGSGYVENLQPVNQNGHCVVGYGNYDRGEGNTHVYGTEVRLYAKEGAYINGMEYGVNKVLWSGEKFMTADQTVTLSEAISAQPNGVVLVWSGYNNGEAQNYDWIFTFVPKFFIQQRKGDGICCYGLCADGHLMKYVYMGDTEIIGHSSNTNTSTYGGVTRANNKYVLRYVIGV